MVFGTAGILLFGWYLVEERKKGRIKKLWPCSALDTVQIMLLGVFLQYAADVCILIAAQFSPEVFQTYMSFLEERGNLRVSLAAFCSTVIAAPLLEEFVYRGILFSKAQKYRSFGICNVIQALIFAVMHGNMLQALLTFLLGLLLGWVVRHFDSVFPAVLLHMMINLCGWLNMAFAVPEFFWMILAAVSGAGIWFFIRRSKTDVSK